ncbi:MAG: outer membrane protein transport protein [Myxococcales bacterium]|nr:outer membrane protein transport protein [Myxococcales bacterium]
MLAGLSNSAFAAGFFLPARGVVPQGRGGAPVVPGGGAHALHDNPAQLMVLDGTRILIEAGVVSLATEFERTPRQMPNGDLVRYPSVSNDHPLDVLPTLVVSSDLGIDRFVLALGLMPPWGARYSYPVDGPQRYASVENTATAGAGIDLGAAVEITDWLRLGATFEWIYFDSTITVVASGYVGPFGDPEDPDLDILMQAHSVDAFTPSGVLGAWVAPIPGTLEMAISFQLPYRIQDDDAELRVRLPSHPIFDDAVVNGDTVSGGFDLPWTLRTGIRWVHPRGDVELDFNLEGWSVHDAIETSPEDVSIEGVPAIDEFVVGPFEFENRWQNAMSLRIGSDFQVIEGLVVRAGFLWEQSAVPEDRMSVFQIDLTKFMPSVGVSYRVDVLNGLEFNAAYGHYFMQSTTVSNSVVTQINPTFSDGALVVGNGYYAQSVDAFGLSVDLGF